MIKRKREKRIQKGRTYRTHFYEFRAERVLASSLSLRKVWLRLPVTHKEMGQMRLLTNGAAGFPFAGEYREEFTFGFNPMASKLTRLLARSLAWLNKVDYLYGILSNMISWRYNGDVLSRERSTFYISLIKYGICDMWYLMGNAVYGTYQNSDNLCIICIWSINFIYTLIYNIKKNFSHATY